MNQMISQYVVIAPELLISAGFAIFAVYALIKKTYLTQTVTVKEKRPVPIEQIPKRKKIIIGILVISSSVFLILFLLPLFVAHSWDYTLSLLLKAFNSF